MGESERQVEVIGEMSVKGNGIQSQFTPASRVRRREKNGSLPNEEESLVSGASPKFCPEISKFQRGCRIPATGVYSALPDLKTVDSLL